MSDEITCPECEGRGGKTLGRDRQGRMHAIVCPFCHGNGVVGGAYEPAEDLPIVESDEPPDLSWNAIEAERPPGCPTCAGSGEVVSLGGLVTGGAARKLATMPCPDCRPT